MQNKSLWSCIREVVEEMSSVLIYELKRNLGKLMAVYMAFMPIIADKVSSTYGQMLLFSVLSLVMVTFVNNIGHKLLNEDKRGLPVPLEKLTKVEDDIVMIEENKEQEAMLYLNSVEEYLEKRGLL